MSRLDDIARRHRKDARREGLAVRLVNALPDGTSEPEAARPFALPSQRRDGVPVWKVLLLMVIVGALAAYIYS